MYSKTPQNPVRRLLNWQSEAFRAVILVSAICSVNTAFAQREGDKIEVISSGVKLKVQTSIGAAVPKGTELAVKKVNGDWLWVEFENKSGWISKGDVEKWRSPEQKRDALIARGNTNLKDGYFYSATSVFDEAIKLDPSSIEALIGRAKACCALCPDDVILSGQARGAHYLVSHERLLSQSPSPVPRCLPAF